MIFRNCYTQFLEPLGEWNLRQFWNISSGIYAKYHVQIMLLFVYTTTHKGFVIFKCRYFKLSWTTTALSQSNCRNFSCSSIGHVTWSRGRSDTRTGAKWLKISGYLHPDYLLFARQKATQECWLHKWTLATLAARTDGFIRRLNKLRAQTFIKTGDYRYFQNHYITHAGVIWNDYCLVIRIRTVHFLFLISNP